MGNLPMLARLRHIDHRNLAPPGVVPQQVNLPCESVVALGRGPACQIVIDSCIYGMVSRRHAEIRYVPTRHDQAAHWWIFDLDSANGTYVNQQQLQGGCRLSHGDQVELGQAGPAFVFELLPSSIQSAAAGSTSHPAAESTIAPGQRSHVTLTQLFPIFSTGLDLQRKAYLVPGAIAVMFVVALFMAIESPLVFNLLLASFLAMGCYYVVYRLCGKYKPAWVLLSTTLATVLLLQSPVLQLFIWFFRDVLPGEITTNERILSFPVRLIQMFFGAGLMEELLKAIPLFLILGFSAGLNPAQKSRWGIVEPLDGILFGAASAIGFTMIETLGQYVPSVVSMNQLQTNLEVSQLLGLQLLIPRLLGMISGHMAYSGYFGYFIGLSVLRPQARWSILLVGYMTASGLHALWNTMGSFSPALLAIVGMVSYGFLAAAIVKARALSPNRHQNFATRLHD